MSKKPEMGRYGIFIVMSSFYSFFCVYISIVTL
jgi:hypothetical protein